MNSTETPASKGVPRAIRFMLQTIFVNAIGFGIITPVVPTLIMSLGAGNVSRASAFGGILSLVYALFQFLCGPLVGNLSDRFGRRPVIIGSQIGFALEFLLMAVAPSLAWLIVARILSGVFGATQGAAQAAIADIAPPAGRARYFSLLGAAFSIGFVLGPAIGGLLAGLDHRAPFFVAAGLAFANSTYGYWACAETLPADRRRAFDWSRANPVGALKQARKLPGILPLALVYFLWQLASIVYPLVWNFFALGKFGWTPALIGLSLATIGIGMAFVNLVITPRCLIRFGEFRTATIGMSIGLIAMLLTAIAPSGWMLYPLCGLISFQSMVHPALTALMSRHGTGTTQGEVQGFGSSVMALGAIVAPVIYNPLHSWFIGGAAPFRFDGAPIALAAVIALFSLILLRGLRASHEIAKPAKSGAD